MGMWAVLFVCELLVPILMIVSGIFFSAGVPFDINSFFGYRTSMSMKNGDTWDFAHRYCGRLWIRIGAVMLPVTVLSSIISLKTARILSVLGIFGVIVIAAQTCVIIISIIMVECKLKKVFDKNGNRIN